MRKHITLLSVCWSYFTSAGKHFNTYTHMVGSETIIHTCIPTCWFVLLLLFCVLLVNTISDIWHQHSVELPCDRDVNLVKVK